MSFILDALKKSESDRQRQSGPALFEVKVAPRRSALPLWGLALGALLAVNLAIVAWMLLRKPALHADTAPPPGIASAPAATPAPAPSTPAPTVVTPPPVTAPPVSAGTVPAGTVANDDEAPATETPPAGFGGHVRRGTVDGVPLYQDIAPGSRIPELRLDLHVYAGAPQERFVMINMHKLREGESLPEGVRLESITPEGAVLAYNGVRFLLPRE